MSLILSHPHIGSSSCRPGHQPVFLSRALWPLSIVPTTLQSRPRHVLPRTAFCPAPQMPRTWIYTDVQFTQAIYACRRKRLFPDIYQAARQRFLSLIILTLWPPSNRFPTAFQPLSNRFSGDVGVTFPCRPLGRRWFLEQRFLDSGFSTTIWRWTTTHRTFDYREPTTITGCLTDDDALMRYRAAD